MEENIEGRKEKERERERGSSRFYFLEFTNQPKVLQRRLQAL